MDEGGSKGRPARDDLKRALDRCGPQGNSPSRLPGAEGAGSCSQQQWRMESEQGAQPPSSLVQSNALLGSRNVTDLNDKMAPAAYPQPSACQNVQSTLETDHRPAGEAHVEAHTAHQPIDQALPHGQGLSGDGLQQLQAQRDKLKQREHDLEERYRQLQDFAQSQIGTAAEEAEASGTAFGEFTKEAESERNPPTRSSIQQFQPTWNAWHPKKAWARPGSATMSQTERPAADSAPVDDMSGTQHTQTLRADQNIQQDAAQLDACRDLEVQRGRAPISRQVPIENLNCGSQSYTEAEAQDPGIGYDKNHGDGPEGLNLISGSNACSQSQQSQGKALKPDSARDLQVQPMPHPFYQQDQQIRTIDSQNEYEQSLGLAQAQKEPDKMQTGSFNAVGEGLDSSLGNMADMRNVTAMLFRAMNYKGAGGKEAAAEDKSVGDGGRNEEQSRFGTRETEQSKTTEVTQVVGHSCSNSHMLDKTGLEAALLSATHQDESRKEPPAQSEVAGEQRLQQELERIQDQKKLISSFLPKDYDYRREPSPVSPTMAANPAQAVRKEVDHERGHSNSSFGKAYNFDMNLSSKFGRNIQEQLSYSKSPHRDPRNAQRQPCFHVQVREPDSFEQSHLTSGYDVHATSKDYRSGLEGRASSNGPATVSSNFVVKAGDKELPREVFNYRDLSQDASRRSRAGLQATDRPISYPTNMTNMTHDQIVVSPESSSQAQKRSSAADQAPLSNNKMSNRSLSWRVEKFQHQPPLAGAATSDAVASQDWYAPGKQETCGQHEEIERARSREVDGMRVDSPSAKRRYGLSPYSKSSRHKDLQNSGLALLKKTSALLKNPPAVSNYKALNFDQDQEAEAAQQSDSQKVLDANFNRKGVILNLYRKNSGVGALNDKESDYRRQQQYAYQHATGQSHERKKGQLHSSFLDKNAAIRQHEEQQTVAEARASPQLEPGKYSRVPPRGLNLSKERSGSRSGQPQSGSSDRAGIRSHGERRAHGKLTLGFLRRLNRNGGGAQHGRPTTDEKSDKLGNSTRSLPRDQKDNVGLRPNLINMSKAQAKDADVEVGAETSSKAGRLSAGDSNYPAGSATSKINRYKKFERELEKHRAALESVEQRTRKLEPDAEVAGTSKLRATEHHPVTSEQKTRQESAERRLQTIRDLEMRNKLLEEQIRQKNLDEAKEKHLTDPKLRSHQEQRSARGYAHASEQLAYNQQVVSPHRTLDSQRGSTFTLGNQQHAGGDSSPPYLMHEAHGRPAAGAWADEKLQRRSLYDDKYNLDRTAPGPPPQPAQHSGSYSMQNMDPPKLNYSYFPGPGGGRAVLNSSAAGTAAGGRGPEGPAAFAPNNRVNETLNEEDSILLQNRMDQQEEMPQQIHTNREQDDGTANVDLSGSFGRRGGSVENNRPHGPHRASVQSEEGLQIQDRSRAKSHAQARPHGAHQAPRPVPLLDQYLHKNEQLRRQQIDRARQADGLRAVSPAPSNDNCSRSNLSRHDLIPCRGPPSVPPQVSGQASYAPVHVRTSGKKDDDERASRIGQLRQNQEVLSRKAQELREASFERLRPRDHRSSGRPSNQEQRTWHEAREEHSEQMESRRQQPFSSGYQDQRRERSPASLAGMNMKSSFGQKMREQAEREHGCSARKPPLFGLQNESKQTSGHSFDREMMGARARNQDDRQILESGTKHDLGHQVESFRPSMHQETPAYPTSSSFYAQAVDPGSRSSEQAGSRRSGGPQKKEEQPVQGAMIYSMFPQTEVDRPSGPSQTQTLDSRSSQAHLLDGQQSVQPHCPSCFVNASTSQSHIASQNTPNAAHSMERRDPGQRQDGLHLVQLEQAQQQQHKWADRAYSLHPEDYQNHGVDVEGCGTPHLPGALTPDEKAERSTRRRLQGRESFTKQAPQAASESVLDNETQANGYGHDGRQLPGYQMDKRGGEGLGQWLPEQRHNHAELVQSEEQTFASIVRSPEIQVTTTELAQDQTQQTATLSKQQEPSLAGTRSSHRRSSHGEEQQPLLPDAFGSTCSENGDIKKLIRLQFEQARMLMDLQKQFLHCQEIEKVHHLESVEQSMSHHFQDGTIASSKEPGSQIDPEEYKDLQQPAPASSGAQRQAATSARPAQAEADSMYGEEGIASVHEASREQRQRQGGRADTVKMASQPMHMSSQLGPEAPARATTPQTAFGQRADSQVKPLKHVSVKSKEGAASRSSKQGEPSQASAEQANSLHPSGSQAQPHAQPLTKQKSSKRSAAAKKSSGPLSHQSRQSSIAIPNLQAMQSNRSLQSAASKQSQAHLSQISQQKASTMALIQKIYQQMEKIDRQISRKEQLDEERYNDMERRMRRLHKKYNKVKRENEQMQIESSQQLLSLQPSRRQQVRSLAVEPGPTSCDFERAKKSASKTKSSKRTSANKARRKSRAGLAKGSLLSESQPFSSVEGTERTIKSIAQGAGQKQHERDIEREEIQIVEHDAGLNRQADRGNYRVINTSSALSQSYPVQAQTPELETTKLETKITQVNELLADEPLRPSDCMSSTQQEVHVDFNQQFPSAKRSHGGAETSGASSAQARSEATVSGAKNSSFGAQFPSAHDASPRAAAAERSVQCSTEPAATDPEATGNKRKNSRGVGEGRRKSHAQRSLQSISQQAELSKQSNDVAALKINSVPSQSSHVAPTPAQPPMSQLAQSKGSSRLLTQGNAPVANSSHSLRPQLPSAKQAPAITSREERSLQKDKGIETPEDVDRAVTCSSGYAGKEACVLLGSTMGMAEESLQLQAERQPAEPVVTEERRAVEAVHEVTALASNQNELENQVQLMNGAIAQLRVEHQSQIETMKSYYQEQINQIREEVQKRDRSQSRGRAGLSSGMGTPAALQNRMKSLSNENILNLTNLSISASEQKWHPSHHQGSVNAPSPSQAQRQQFGTAASLSRCQAEGAQKVPEKDKFDAQAQEQAELALTKLMDQKKFTDTLEQLNKAVSQKEKLEQKLLRIKDKIKMAKDIKNNQRRRSKDREHVEVPNGQSLGTLPILSRETEIQSTIERDVEDFRDKNADKEQQVKGMLAEDELAGLSGVTLSDVPARAREANEESSAPIQSTGREDTGRQAQELQRRDGEPLGLEPLLPHDQESNAAAPLGIRSQPASLTPQDPSTSGAPTEDRETTTTSAMAAAKGHASWPTAEFGLGHGSSQVSITMQPEGGRSLVNRAAYDNENRGPFEHRQQFERGINISYIPNDLMRGNAGARGHGAIQSYESQLVAASNYSTGSARETLKSETLGRAATRPMVAPYTGGERFLQPFIPGQANLPLFEPREAAGSSTNNVLSAVSRQQLPGSAFHHSAALAPGLSLLEQQPQPPQADKLHTIQQNTQDPVEGLNEMYLRDTTQPTTAGGSHHNAQSTLESTTQRLIMQDSRRGIYQKIVGLQSLQNQQRSSYSSSTYGLPVQRSYEVGYAAQPGQPVLMAQQPHQAAGPGLGTTNGMTTVGGTTLSYSLPGTRMGTITDPNQGLKFIYMQDQADAGQGQVPFHAGQYDPSNTALPRRMDQAQRADDFVSQEMPPGQLPVTSVGPYAAGDAATSSLLYLKARPVLPRPVQQMHDAPTVLVPTHPARQVGPAASPAPGGSSPFQAPSRPPSHSQTSQSSVLQPRLAGQQLDDGEAGSTTQGEPSENEASYTMHSSSMEGSRSAETSQATSDAASSCPYSERSISQAQEADLTTLHVQVQRPPVMPTTSQEPSLDHLARGRYWP